MSLKKSIPPSSKHLAVHTLAEIGQIVRTRRHAENLRIDDAAALCGVSVDLMSRLENGGRVTADRLLKVLDSLGLSVLVVPKDQAFLVEQSLVQHAPFGSSEEDGSPHE
jgi:transcriptional regulator with XRE-family HTH domain